MFQSGDFSEEDEPSFDLPTETAYSAEDLRHDEELRPQRLDDVVGQRKVVERLRIILDATRKRNEPLSHLLLDGPPGLGKTTLATVLP
ncbi:Holliday junction branch migration DNA helicase RuvB, partial [bacterium]|nr:Holliday junction branch migration DNA helicase RuvB [bacterium]